MERGAQMVVERQTTIQGLDKVMSCNCQVQRRETAALKAWKVKANSHRHARHD